MAKKTAKKIAGKDADQYMLRLPTGLRDRVARRAAENGRSMNTEIIEAIEKHLLSADRVTQLWEIFEKHREYLEAIPHIWDAVEELEMSMSKVAGENQEHLRRWRMEQEEKAEKAREHARVREDADAIMKHAREPQERVEAEQQKQKG
jgi:hypothetical protein